MVEKWKRKLFRLNGESVELIFQNLLNIFSTLTRENSTRGISGISYELKATSFTGDSNPIFESPIFSTMLSKMDRIRKISEVK